MREIPVEVVGFAAKRANRDPEISRKGVLVWNATDGL